MPDTPTVADDIVRRLADDGMIVHTGEMSHECASCGAFVPTRVEDHRPDCLWVAAVEWVKRNPSDRVDIIGKVLMWNMTLTDDDQWVMDEDSPHSMAEKVVRALDGEAPDAD